MARKNEQEVKNLAEEARALRRDLRQSHFSGEFTLPAWKKAAYLVIIVAAVGGSVFLLLSSGSRQRMLSVAADSLGLFQDHSQVFRLPSPPPKAAQSRVLIEPGWSSPADDFILEPSDLGAPEQPVDSTNSFVAPAKSSANQQAFQMLQQSSDLVSRLVTNQLGNYEFKEWKPRQDRAPIFVLDLVVVRTQDQAELLLIWQVNLENQQVRALNQNARDLQVEFDK
jgi:hypothetical protein